MIYDTIIIGGGVSGLISANSLTKLNRKVLVVEQGKHVFERRRTSPFDTANGIGGAGLFSDGKVSLYPSATFLWKLEPNLLKKAYNQIKNLLEFFSIEIGEYPQIEDDKLIQGRKDYDSLILSLEQRYSILFKLINDIDKESLLLNRTVLSIKKDNNIYLLDILDNITKLKHQYQCKTIILAGGKHSYTQMLSKQPFFSRNNKIVHRELGIRIECENKDFDFLNDSQKDVKIIDSIGGFELRTFCCCKNGGVLHSSSYDLSGINGTTSDLLKNGKSNVGIHIRLPENYPYNEEMIPNSVSEKLSEFMEKESYVFDINIDNAIKSFVRKHMPKTLSSDSVVYYPSIEYFGETPSLSTTLRCENESIWISGDATGQFRGLLPAMITGSFVADCVHKELTDKGNEISRKFNIKISPSEKKKVVFTAQSKQNFYCKDAICEYVFNKNCIPINPFRAFGYFLGDRVDRNLVRNGNNEMIERCDELWVFGNISDGVLFEIFKCIQNGKQVRFFSCSSFASEIRELAIDDISFEPEVHAKKIRKEDLLQLVGGKVNLKSRGQLNWLDLL